MKSFIHHITEQDNGPFNFEYAKAKKDLPVVGDSQSMRDAMEKIGKQRDTVARKLDVEKRLKANLKKAEMEYDRRILSKLNPKVASEIEEYTPEQKARLEKIRAGIDDAARKGQQLMSAPVETASKASRMATIAKTVAPALRVAGRALGAAAIPLSVAGALADAKTAGEMQVKNVKREMEQSRREGRPYREPLPTNPGFKF
jgi:hypothetical protein